MYEIVVYTQVNCCDRTMLCLTDGDTTCTSHAELTLVEDWSDRLRPCCCSCWCGGCCCCCLVSMATAAARCWRSCSSRWRLLHDE